MEQTECSETSAYKIQTPGNYPEEMTKFSHYLPTCLGRWNRQSVPKGRHIKFTRRGITQKKVHNIQNTAKVWNQEYMISVRRLIAPSLILELTTRDESCISVHTAFWSNIPLTSATSNLIKSARQSGWIYGTKTLTLIISFEMWRYDAVRGLFPKVFRHSKLNSIIHINFNITSGDLTFSQLSIKITSHGAWLRVVWYVFMFRRSAASTFTLQVLSTFLCNAGTYLSNYMASHPSRQ